MKKQMTLQDIPDLPEYVPVAAVAAQYGVHKGTVYYMIYTQLAFKTVYKVGTGPDDTRPLLLLRADEVEQVFAERERQAQQVTPPSLAQQLREWNRRVKQWGYDTGWDDGQTPISKSGPAPRLLVDAYVVAHPQDPRPE